MTPPRLLSPARSVWLLVLSTLVLFSHQLSQNCVRVCVMCVCGVCLCACVYVGVVCVCVCVCAYVVKCPNCPGTHSVRKAGLLRTGVTAPTPGLTCFHSDKEPVVLGLTHLDTGLLRVCFHGLQGCQCSPILHNDAAVLRLA